jgi:hypothetical protein
VKRPLDAVLSRYLSRYVREATALEPLGPFVTVGPKEQPAETMIKAGARPDPLDLRDLLGSIDLPLSPVVRQYIDQNGLKRGRGKPRRAKEWQADQDRRTAKKRAAAWMKWVRAVEHRWKLPLLPEGELIAYFAEKFHVRADELRVWWKVGQYQRRQKL